MDQGQNCEKLFGSKEKQSNAATNKQIAEWLSVCLTWLIVCLKGVETVTPVTQTQISG